MRRLAAAAAVPVLVGLPVWIDASWPVVLLAAAAGAFCLGAVRRLSLQGAVTGGVLALIALTLALRNAAAPPHVLLAATFGVALLVLLEGTHFASRLDGAAIARAWCRRHLAWWSARTALSLAAAVAIAAVAPLAAMALPALSGAFLAGLGIVAAFAAALALAWPRSGE